MTTLVRTGLVSVLAMTVAASASGELQNVTLGDARVNTHGPVRFLQQDLLEAFDSANVTDSPSASLSYTEKSGGVELPGIFLHPPATGDASVAFPSVHIGDVASGDSANSRRPFLLFRIGLRENIPWGNLDNLPNGVRFSVAIDGDVVFEENLADEGWQARAIDLHPWAGKTIKIELRTNAIDGRPNYDWAVFGQPMIVAMPVGGRIENLPNSANGVALVHIECAEDSNVTLAVLEAREKASLRPGTHWLPVHFAHPGKVEFEVARGSARMVEAWAASHEPMIREEEFYLSSPLVIAGEPFTAFLRVKNSGLGYLESGETRSLRIEGPGTFGPNALREAPIGALRAGDERILKWDNLVASAPGNYILPNGEPLHVFPAAPNLDDPWKTAGLEVLSMAEDNGATRTGVVRPSFGGASREGVRAVLETNRLRLVFVSDSSGATYGAVYAGGQPRKRMGSIYPLTYAVVAAEGQSRGKSLQFLARGFKANGKQLVVEGELTSGDGITSDAQIWYTADLRAPRVLIQTKGLSRSVGGVLAFGGPSVLACDRNPEGGHAFALFPGLEYLEEGEGSSSTRDLAYPLSERRVPAIHKIATPLMAVQTKDGGLLSLMWNPKQEWAPGEAFPAARFQAPSSEQAVTHTLMALFAPSVGRYTKENTWVAHTAYGKPTPITLEATLVVDSQGGGAYVGIDPDPRRTSPSQAGHRGWRITQAMRHYFEVYGLPRPSPLPRSWEAERALCRDAYYHTVWDEKEVGWAHCQGWKPLLATGHAVPLLIDMRAGVADAVRLESRRRIDAVIDRALREEGPQYLWTNAACHIMLGELPFLEGYLPEALTAMRVHARTLLATREKGLWVWRPENEKMATLGTPGDHTLGQAAQPAYFVLRTARLSGDLDLMEEGLEAMEQMLRYEVPRGAQMWECPLYQPDILAAAQAIRAYCEAYRMTGDERHLERARYWAWTGLPFLYTWELDGYPTMRYNAIAVIGSTFYTHSWIGLPVVWCGLVYAYALQDLALFDDSFSWTTIAEGITNSAMWQQYADGPSKGCYPDSWNMVTNTPNPADINPENILVNALRLRGISPEPAFARVETASGAAFLNAGAELGPVTGSVKEGRLTFKLKTVPGFPAYALLAPVEMPRDVQGVAGRVQDSATLRASESGWQYSPQLRGVVIKCSGGGMQPVSIAW